MLKLLGILPVLLEFISKLIKEVETLQSDGQQKKTAVLESVREFLRGVGVDPDKVLPMISFLIDAYVFFYNTTGLFTHSKK